MNRRSAPSNSRGFALVLVVTLVGLLVLAVYALGVLTRVQTQVTSSTGQQRQARQHALLALRIGLGELQHHAGPDARITGMAGITGIPEGGTRTTRHWCGVWNSDGSFVAWLASGAQSTAAAVASELAVVKLVAQGSVGASVSDSEHVIAGVLPVVVPETIASPGSAAIIGAYAYVVLDEGVKVSARTTEALPGDAQLRPVLAAGTTSSAQGRLRTALDTPGAQLAQAVSYEQLRLLPGPSMPLTPSTLQDNFHHVTLSAPGLVDDELRSGRININTTSVHVWRSLFETYNTADGVEQMGHGDVIDRGKDIARDLANSSSGKFARGPFPSIAALGSSELLAGHLPPEITPEEFMAVIAPTLTVRSDTFRIRGYGEARNPLRDGAVEASAWCEAMVQRLPAPAPEGHGRRFAIAYFRWLGPEDI